MINLEKLATILEHFKARFPSIWRNEKYKWQAVQHFQNTWNIDAEDFGKMFEAATAKTLYLADRG